MKKGRRALRKQEDDMEPFKPYDLTSTHNNFVDEKILNSSGSYMFKGKFLKKEGKKCQIVLLPNSFFPTHQRDECKALFHLVEIQGYFRLPPWGVDVHQSYELMTNIKEEKGVELIGENGEAIQVQISEEIA